MLQVKLWLKSGAMVHFEAEDMNFHDDSGKVQILTCQPPNDSRRSRLSWIDTSEIAAIVVSGSADKSAAKS